MQCPRCQHENPTGMKFCGECASPLAATCPSCGAANPPENKFCGQCAAPLRTAPTAKFTAPDSYTPKHLAERILTSKAALEGERKQVTVLFADLKGSMELLADRDPEEARKLLDPVLEHMMEAVHRYEGTVNQVMGDGIMALFGAPLAHEDHAVRACYAALRMQVSVTKYGEEVFRARGVTVKIRVGLNSGEVVVRAIGSDLHMDYTAVGQTTHLAARMEQLAAPGTILLSPAALQLVEGYVKVKGKGPVPVKGLATPMEVYELVGAGSIRSRLQAAAARGLTRFVGRDPEIEQLRLALDLAGSGQGQVVAVVGEPGVGKSRLDWEFTHSDRIQGWLVLESRSVSYGKATSYLPVIDLLKWYFQVEAQDDTRKIREKVTAKILSLDRHLESSLHAFLSLLDVPTEDVAWERLDPSQRRQRTLDGVKGLLLRESQVQPLLLLFEDLHWIDTETQALLDSLVESLPTARLLLLTNYRPEYRHSWGSKTYYSQLRVDPLPVEMADELLTDLLGTHPSIESLKRTLLARTECNPLFLEESIRTLVETGTLLGGRGSYTLAEPNHTSHIPATLHAILAERIDRLASDDKGLLQAASVIGKSVPLSELLAIATSAEPEVRQCLARLQAAEFLYEAALYPDLEYTFKHALTQEVAYASMLQERRRGLHAQVVGIIENLYPERLAEHVERLAHHAFRGEAWENAAIYSSKAADKAFRRCAFREAVVDFKQALTALGKLPDLRGTIELSIDVRHQLRHALLALGDTQSGIEQLQKAEHLARRIDDRPRLGLVLSAICNHYWFGGHVLETRRIGDEALNIANEIGDLSLQITMNFHFGQAYVFWGEAGRALGFLRTAIGLLEGDLTRDYFGAVVFPGLRAQAYIVVALSQLGEFEEAINCGQEALQVAESLRHPLSAAFTLGMVAWSSVIQGNHPLATSLLERALALCREANILFLQPGFLGLLGYARLLAGSPADALLLLRQGLDRQEMLGFRFNLAGVLVFLGEACLEAGDTENTLGHASRALTVARVSGERGAEASALRLFGDVHNAA
jgi:class 3 adenylate cyclase/tetratricopeptide (TPR) repeat protein